MNSSTEIPEFGTKRENEERRDGGCAIVFDPETKRYAVGRHTADGKLRLFSGGVGDDEDIQAGILREVVEESGLHDFSHVEVIGEAFTHYYNILKKVNRVGKATCLLVILKSRNLVETKLEEHEKFTLAWVTAEELFSNWNAHNETNNYDHWIYFMNIAVRRLKELGY
ncbi:MAG: NUDIX domain-containing protein [Minisyncoccia bacterium]